MTIYIKMNNNIFSAIPYHLFYFEFLRMIFLLQNGKHIGII